MEEVCKWGIATMEGLKPLRVRWGWYPGCIGTDRPKYLVREKDRFVYCPFCGRRLEEDV